MLAQHALVYCYDSNYVGAACSPPAAKRWKLSGRIIVEAMSWFHYSVMINAKIWQQFSVEYGSTVEEQVTWIGYIGAWVAEQFFKNKFSDILIFKYFMISKTQHKNT